MFKITVLDKIEISCTVAQYDIMINMSMEF